MHISIIFLVWMQRRSTHKMGVYVFSDTSALHPLNAYSINGVEVRPLLTSYTTH